MLTDRQIALVEESFRSIAPIADEVARRFYVRLFQIDPSASVLFAGTFMTLQRRKLMAALGAIVSGLRFMDEIRPMLESFGARHAEYGVIGPHYDSVRTALLAALRATLGDTFDVETEAAWDAAYTEVAAIMQAGAVPGTPATLETLRDT
ncbi:globin domain-containing protein [Elioraea sp.]|uniref:globin domain-containing protein n=1 Tax=Elioraea sp. TaxID=2185103 RepID=UPI003F6E4E55